MKIAEESKIKYTLLIKWYAISTLAASVYNVASINASGHLWMTNLQITSESVQCYIKLKRIYAMGYPGWFIFHN